MAFHLFSCTIDIFLLLHYGIHYVDRLVTCLLLIACVSNYSNQIDGKRLGEAVIFVGCGLMDSNLLN